MVDKEKCSICMTTKEHDEPHYVDEWPHRPGDIVYKGSGHCTGCNPNVSSYLEFDSDEEFGKANYIKVAIAELPCYNAVCCEGVEVHPDCAWYTYWSIDKYCAPCRAKKELENDS